MHCAFNIPQNWEHDLSNACSQFCGMLKARCILNSFFLALMIFCDGTPLTVSCCQAWNNASCFPMPVCKNLSSSHFQCRRNCLLMSTWFCSIWKWKFMVTIMHAPFGGLDLQSLSALAHVKCLFCLLVPAKKHGSFLNDFINMIPVNLIALCDLIFYCLWLRFRGVLFMPSVMNTCSPKSDSTESYIFLSINSFHLLMNVYEKHVFCHQTLFHCRCFNCTDIIALLSTTFTSTIQSPVAEFYNSAHGTWRSNKLVSCKLTTVILMVWRLADRWQYDAGMQHDGAVGV